MKWFRSQISVYTNHVVVLSWTSIAWYECYKLRLIYDVYAVCFFFLQEYAESAMNELLGWYGYCNNNGYSSNQTNFMTDKLSAMHTTKMPKHAISQASMLTATTSTDNGHASHAFDDFDANMDSRSSTDDSMKMSPNFLIAKRPLHSSSTQEKTQLGSCQPHIFHSI